MNFRKNKPFVVTDRRLEQNEAKLSVFLTVAIILFGFIVPLLNDGFLSLFHKQYIEGNYAVVVLDYILYYLIPAISCVARYICYGAIIFSVYTYGARRSAMRIFLLLSGVCFSYLTVYICTCITNRYVMFDLAESDSTLALFTALFMMVFMLLKNTVLVVYTSVIAARSRRNAEKQPGADTVPATGGLFTKRNVYFRYSLYFFALSLAVDVAARAVSTVMDIYAAGEPTNAEHYIYFLGEFGSLIVINALGLCLLVFTCKYFSKIKASVRADS